MDTADKVVLEVEGVNAVLVYLGTRPWSEVNALMEGLQLNSLASDGRSRDTSASSAPLYERRPPVTP